MNKKIFVLKTKIVLLAALFISLAGFSQKQWTLKECVNHALENNITIKQNKLNLDIAKTDLKNAKGNFLPTLNASTGGSFGIGPVINPATNTRVGSTTSYNGSIGLNAGVNVFNGFRNINTKKQALLSLKGSKYDINKVENDISLNVVNTYLNVLFAKENLAIAKTQAIISKKQINRVKAQFEAGAVPKGDLLNVQSTAANDIQSLVIQENTLNLALLQLSQLLQVSSGNFDVASYDVEAPSTVLLYGGAKEVYDKALSNRPEIKRAKLNVENSTLGIKIAKSAYMPSVNASLGASSNYYYDLKISQAQADLFSQLDNQLRYSLNFNVNIPIFNGFKTDANVERSEINKLISKTNLENQKLQLQQEIEKSFFDVKAAVKTFEAAEISLNAQKEAFKNAQVSYDYGSMTQFDFDQVRNRLVNAEGAMIRSKYDYVFKTKVLKFYYGESIID